VVDPAVMKKGSGISECGKRANIA